MFLAEPAQTAGAVIPGLVPGIQRAKGTGARGWLDTGYPGRFARAGKPRYDT